jgi:hypothetical protein
MDRSSWWFAFSIVVAGCGDDIAVGGSSESESGEAFDLCESALDPEIYTTPAWSPEPFVASKDCPALAGPLLIELATATVTVTVRMGDEVIVPTMLQLRGRDGEGNVHPEAVGDGTFAATLLPGRYDVWVGNAPGALLAVERSAVADLGVVGDVDVDVDVPPNVTLSGQMTLDGELAGDPFPHISIKEAGATYDHPLWLPVIGRMDAGSYSIVLAPGSYAFRYNFCDPNESGWIHIGENPCYDPSLPEVSSLDSDAPQQYGVPLADDVAIGVDTILDFDVKTVRFSGKVEIEGGLNPSVSLYTEEGWGWLDSDEFDERIVMGTYAFRVHDHSRPIIDALVLEEDTHVERVVPTFTMSVLYEAGPAVTQWPEALPPRLLVYPRESFVNHYFELPFSPLLVFAGSHRVEHIISYCWPDLGHAPPSVKFREYDADIADSLTIELAPPELARVRVEYAESSTHRLKLEPAEGGPTINSIGVSGDVATHGIVPAGAYRINGQLVDVSDGTTLRVVEEPKMLTLELTVDGQPTPFDDHRLVIEPGSWVTSDGVLLEPGHYEVIFYGDPEPGLPSNSSARVGCFTVEG